MKNLGVYIHIPYCRSKCIYCDFYSLPAPHAELDEYTDALMLEMNEVSKKCADHVVDTLYFGGGTPTILGGERLNTLIGHFARRFKLDAAAEISLEANPESATKELLETIGKAGFNRISFGVQSFSDAELKSLGRIHTAEEAKTSILLARDSGFENIGLDLMYGLPRQGMESWEKTLHAAVKLPVRHISCYGLRPEEGTPLMSSPLMEALPDDDLQADMYLYAVDFLRENGFFQYEISNFAKSGGESAHNLKYWRQQEYYGMGAAAHSDFCGLRFGAAADVKAYIEGIRESRPVFTERRRPSVSQRLEEYIMLRLRLSEGLDFEYMLEKYGVNYSVFDKPAEKLISAGLAEREGKRFFLNANGFLLSNMIIQEFWDML